MNPLFNTELPVEERAKETIKQMTLEEKVSQLVYKSALLSVWEYRLIIGGMNVCTVWPGAAPQRYFPRQSAWPPCLTLIF